MKKRNLCFVLVLIFMVSCIFSGCDENGADKETGEKIDSIGQTSSVDTTDGADGDYVYEAKSIEPEDELSIFTWGEKSPSGIYVYGHNVDYDSGSFIWYLKEMDYCGKTIKDYDLSWLEECENISLIPSSDNLLWLKTYGENKSTGDSYERLWKYEGNEPKLILDLSELNTERIGTIVVNSDFIVFETISGYVETLICYDLEGNLKFNVKVGEVEPFKNDSILVLNGDEILVSRNVEDETVVSRLDTENQALSEICRFDKGVLRYADGDTLYVSNMESVSEYSVSSQSSKQLFTWKDFGCDPGKIFKNGEGKLVYCGGDGERAIFALLDKTTATQRQEIVLGVNNSRGTNLSTLVNRFNQSNSQYKISIKNYGEFPNGQDILNTEIISGEGPDIILLYDFSNEIIKDDVLEDLLPFFESDETLNLDNVLTGPLEAMKTNGKLLDFIPLFQIETILYDSEYFHGTDKDGCVNLGNIENLFNGTVLRSDLLQLAFCGSNAKELKAEDIKAVLELAKVLPEKYEDYVAGGEICPLVLSCCENIEMLSVYGSQFGENLKIAGLPFYGENSGIIVPFVGWDFGMNKNSTAKDGVWEFFKFLTEKDIAEYEILNIIPLNLDKYEYKQSEKEKVLMEDVNEDGSLNSRAAFYSSLSDKERQTFNDELFNNCCGIMRNNSSTYDIITPLAEEYFSGKKTVEEVTSDIISRLELYNAEHS